MSSGESANRQAKSIVISEAVSQLRRKVGILEEFISELQGTPPSVTKLQEKLSPSPMPPFVEIYNNLYPALGDLSERLEKATQELREILI